jgi:hypothetical protein
MSDPTANSCLANTNDICFMMFHNAGILKCKKCRYNMTETNTFPYMAIPWSKIKVWEKADILLPMWHAVSIWDSNADIMKM